MLGYEYQETSHGTSLINEYCYDLPLLDSLQSLLKCDSIVEQVRSVIVLIRAHPGSHNCLVYSSLRCTKRVALKVK